MAYSLSQVIQSFENGAINHRLIVKKEEVGLVEESLNERNIPFEIKPYQEKSYNLLIIGGTKNA